MTSQSKQSGANPYKIIKSLYVTEKSMVLQNLKSADSNSSLRRCEAPKYVFLVDVSANKKQIAQALEEIYHEKKISVSAVNTINMKGKKRRMRGRPGRRPACKKAIVTLQPGDSLDEQ